MTGWSLKVERDGLEAVHGGPGPGGYAEGVVDFSVNVNPFGPAPAAAEAWTRADPVSYPDPSSLAAREVAARLWGVDVASVRFSGGATSLLHDAALAWLEPGGVGVVPEPCFAEYARAVTLARGRLVRIPPADHGGSIDVAGTMRAIREHDARMVFLGRPNTPTGEVMDEDVLAMLVAGLPERCLLVLDESFLSFHVGTVAAPPVFGVSPRVLSVRSVTKDCGLAGLRAGFAVGPKEVLAFLDRVSRPWSASAPAQAAARASLMPESVAYLDLALGRLARETEALAGAAAAAGLEPRHSSTNFFCAWVPGVNGGSAASGDGRLRAFGDGAPGEAAEALATALDGSGFRVRRCASFGMPDHLRIGARLPEQNRRLITALRTSMSARRGLVRGPGGPEDPIRRQ